MGNRLSGTLAILAMDRFERTFIYQHPYPSLTIYARFIDDIGTVVNNPNEAQLLLTYLNSKHPTIKFELELPSDDHYLPILDVQIKLDTDGNLHHRLYTKPASKQLTLHYRSHHPTATKKNLIRNELRRATLCSSTDNRHVSLTKTQNKLQRNGYPHSWIHEKKTKKPKRTSQQNGRPTPLTLNLPFISDTFNHNVRRILDRHNIPARLTNRRNTTIARMQNKLCDVTKCLTTVAAGVLSCRDRKKKLETGLLFEVLLLDQQISFGVRLFFVTRCPHVPLVTCQKAHT